MELLRDGLEDLDVLAQQAVDEGGDLHALGAGVLGEEGLHLVIEVDRHAQLRAGAVELAALALEKSISAGMSSSGGGLAVIGLPSRRVQRGSSS
ncbi:hypothetical protein [Pelomonas cellulosilytica]|uniref:GHMP kinase C-terminal domain-containing protein n=1 Tax=Pelomonas cellulosilytica TaxID=2906762 RepID=A0ABS8Y4D0_9BURK|nr:hypothetical protein [Pelomonas sp. P8]MCE4558089.1 hypothetical protein [Pelomonas sp. P8]